MSFEILRIEWPQGEMIKIRNTKVFIKESELYFILLSV